MPHVPWDHIVDVLVVGSGAGGLTAALTAAEQGCEVEVIEKAELLGGTSAWSGGMPWVPQNRHMFEAGFTDSREEALEYLAGLACDREPDHSLVELYVDRGAEALDFVQAHSALELVASLTYSDYFADRPGGKLGRSVEPKPFDSPRILGDWHERVRDTPHIPRLTQDEMAAAGSRRALPLQDGAVPMSITDLIAKREAEGTRVLGAALISGILSGVVERNVSIRTSTPAKRLVIEDGEVVGVIAEHEGRELAIGARKGVVLASGGFEWNKEFVRAYMGVPELFPLSPPTNVGDGLVMGLEAGAAVGNMTNAIAFPCTYDEHSELEGGPLGFMAAPRNDPGCIVVNRAGRRFTNEGVTYMDLAKVHRNYDALTASYPNEGPVWMIFDQTTRDRTIIGDFVPGEPVPEWVHEAATIGELATKIGVEPAVLEDEVTRFNGYAAAGKDPEFLRGEIWWEGFQTGGPSPEKNLAELQTAPFYAMKLHNGVLGTVGGLRIDEHARVRSVRGGLIPGLHAVGNVAAGIFGQTYPGGGGTLGPGITFGYLAGLHLAQDATARSLDEPSRALADA